MTVTLPYINGLSESVRQIVTQLGIKVVLYPLSTLHHMLVHLTDPVPLENRRDLCTVYFPTDAPMSTLDR